MAAVQKSLYGQRPKVLSGETLAWQQLTVWHLLQRAAPSLPLTLSQCHSRSTKVSSNEINQTRSHPSVSVLLTNGIHICAPLIFIYLLATPVLVV